ncbi:hypothetical protein A7A08_02386 [Methyloligella halotolerans]|uniref:Uncharacterized protein n=1 Tax=Methyloligella halotolerans TaxID=1177755 RepID=A0A1E2RX02_9HYPH|nr:hypothetical protein [Methyloligella halotolerans]ODA66618.1 hypothetical protein A7A08_02386 [Methyloligella halotolerans]
MRLSILAALLLAFGTLVALPTHSEAGLFERFGKRTAQTAEGVGRGTARAGRGVARGAETAGRGVGRGAARAGRGVGHGFMCAVTFGRRC